MISRHGDRRYGTGHQPGRPGRTAGTGMPGDQRHKVSRSRDGGRSAELSPGCPGSSATITRYRAAKGRDQGQTHGRTEVRTRNEHHRSSTRTSRHHMSLGTANGEHLPLIPNPPASKLIGAPPLDEIPACRTPVDRIHAPSIAAASQPRGPCPRTRGVDRSERTVRVAVSDRAHRGGEISPSRRGPWPVASGAEERSDVLARILPHRRHGQPRCADRRLATVNLLRRFVR
jgi:hypothetical protein